MKKELTPEEQHRFDVYSKTSGHCALCGNEMDITNFTIIKINQQEDAVRKNHIGICLPCNQDMKGFPLEKYRNLIHHTQAKLRNKSKDYQRARRFDLITEKPAKPRFYFEKGNI